MAIFGVQRLRHPRGQASGDAHQAASASASGREPRPEAVDPVAEPLVGPLDGGVGAPGDAMGAVDEGPIGRGRAGPRRCRATADVRCSTSAR